MEAARKRLLVRLVLVAVAVFAVAAIFSAYLRPDMRAAFADIMSFCATILR